MIEYNGVICNNAIINNLEVGTLTLPQSGLIPLGGIIPSKVIPDLITTGYVLCNGAAIPAGCAISGTTPNLNQDRFLKGFTSSNSTGGSYARTYTPPIHKHGIIINATSATHNHTLSSATFGNGVSHSHSMADVRAAIGASADDGNRISANAISRYRANSDYRHQQSSETTVSRTYNHHTKCAGDTTSNVSSQTAFIFTHADHSHTVTATCTLTGGDAGYTLNPRYINLYFIMRVI